MMSSLNKSESSMYENDNYGSGIYIDEEIVEDNEVSSGVVNEVSSGVSLVSVNNTGSVAQESYDFQRHGNDPDVEEGNNRKMSIGEIKANNTNSSTNSFRSIDQGTGREEQPKEHVIEDKKETRKIPLAWKLSGLFMAILVATGVFLILFLVIFDDESKSSTSTEAGVATLLPTDAPENFDPTSAVPTAGPPEEPGAGTSNSSSVQPRSIQLSGGPFFSSNTRLGSNPMFGRSLALVGDFLAVGEPNEQTSAVGDIVIRKRGGGSWEQRSSGFASGTRQFGSSMDGAMIQNTPSILVGASETRDDGALSGSGAGFGSAHFYQLEASSGEWMPVGKAMRPTMLLQESGGKFGSSVSMAADVLRVAIGAPESSLDFNLLDTGRVYTYEYDGSDWQPMGNPIVGTGFGDRIGESVAMSKDGSRMLVGSPGDHNGAGAVWYYEWNSVLSQWESIFALRGQDNSNEALGTTVAILSDNGRIIGFGGPAWGNNQGRIEIFEESTIHTGFFDKVGNEDIVGDDGDRVGSTLCGAKGLLALGTETGSLRVYELDTKNNLWVQIVNEPNLGSPVVSMAIAEDASSIAVGHDNQQVHVYDLI